MQVGDVYYRRIDNCECEIKGFFYLHHDGTMSIVVDNYKLLKSSCLRHGLEPLSINVLFHNNTFDTIENLYTNLYMTVDEYSKMKEYTQKMENAKGLYSAFQVASDYPTETPNWKQVYQEILDQQEHHEEPLWYEEDLVPSKIETRKKFKLW